MKFNLLTPGHYVCHSCGGDGFGTGGSNANNHPPSLRSGGIPSLQSIKWNSSYAQKLRIYPSEGLLIQKFIQKYALPPSDIFDEVV